MIFDNNALLQIVSDNEAKAKREYEEFAEIRAEQKNNELLNEIYEIVWGEDNQIFEFENDKMYYPDVTKLCQEYADNYIKMLEDKRSILFTGDVGVGKTFFAECTLNRIIRNSVHDNRPTLVASYTAPEIIGICQDFKNSHLKGDLLYKMRKADFVMIDDIGAQRTTDFAYDQLFDVINTRYRTRKPIIVTANISKTELLDKNNLFRWRIFDRIIENSISIEITGTSKRLEIHREKSNFNFN